jgi:hypothetical protein
MRWVLTAAIVAFALAAHADTVPPGMSGNDVGGIIQWTPEAQYVYRDLAFLHCARFNKIAVISSVHRRYGDYVGFRCYFPREYDPRKAFLYGRYGRCGCAGAAYRSTHPTTRPSTLRLHRHRDRLAVAPAHAFIGAAGIEQRVAEPQGAADNDDDDRQQDEVGVATLGVGFGCVVAGALVVHCNVSVWPRSYLATVSFTFSTNCLSVKGLARKANFSSSGRFLANASSA